MKTKSLLHMQSNIVLVGKRCLVVIVCNHRFYVQWDTIWLEELGLYSLLHFSTQLYFVLICLSLACFAISIFFFIFFYILYFADGTYFQWQPSTWVWSFHLSQCVSAFGVLLCFHFHMWLIAYFHIVVLLKNKKPGVLKGNENQI